MNPGGEAEEQFKEIGRAYEVLSNPEKRQAYDMGADPNASGGGFGAGFGFTDIFETFFGAATSARGPVSRQRRGQDALIRIEVDLAEAVFGSQRELQLDTAVVCPVCQGSCSQPGTAPRVCDVCRGRGQVQRVARSFLGQVMTTQPCTTCQGFGSVIPDPCLECSGEGRVRTRRSLTIKIPPGVDTGTRIQLAGQAEVGPAGGPPGDLYVEVVERQHPTFTRRGDDLHCTVEIPMTAAALGTSLYLDTLDGPEELDIRPGTQSGEVITLRARGQPPARPAAATSWSTSRCRPHPHGRAAGGPDPAAGEARGEERPSGWLAPPTRACSPKLRDRPRR